MELIRLILSPFWKLLFLLNFITSVVVWFPLIFIGVQNRKTYRFVFFIQRCMGAQIAFGSFIFFKTYWRTDKKKLPHPCIIVANHTSYIDIVLSYLFIPMYYVFMAKVELNKVPLFGVFFKKMQIPVDRSSRMSSHKAFKRAGEELSLGNSVFIYPEGTISSEGKLRPFKNGPFKLAIENQVPVLPITYIDNWKILQSGGFFKAYGNPGLSRIIIHEPIPTLGMTEENLVNLRQQVFDLTQSTLEEFRSVHKR